MNNMYFGKPSLTENEDFLIIKDHWSKDIENFVLEKNIDSLYLNYALGWKDNDVRFLRNLTNLKKLKIIGNELSNIDSINNLHNLTYLYIDASSKSFLDFSNFPNLNQCIFHWIKGSINLSSCQKIEKLFLYNYPESTLDFISELISLKELHLISAKKITSIKNINKLFLLEILELSYLSKLSCIPPLYGMEQLRHLEISSCKKINNIDNLAKLSNLSILLLENLGDIISLKPLVECKNLEYLGFTESTKILDGDFSFIDNLSKLKTIVYQNRRHYFYKRDELQQMLNKKHFIG